MNCMNNLVHISVTSQVYMNSLRVYCISNSLQYDYMRRQLCGRCVVWEFLFFRFAFAAILTFEDYNLDKLSPIRI